jgi:O-methyltransferase involved in polyketide biosynthesis
MRVELAGVPETLLWTLWFRAIEARRDDTVLPRPAGRGARRSGDS